MTLKDLHFSVDWWLEWKNQEIPITVKAVRHRAYPQTKYEPAEPAYWDILKVELPEGYDHLEDYAWQQVEASQEQIEDMLEQRLSSWLDRQLSGPYD